MSAAMEMLGADPLLRQICFMLLSWFVSCVELTDRKQNYLREITRC